MPGKACKLPKKQNEKVIRAFDVEIECDVEDQDHPKCRLVNIRPIYKSATHEIHSVTQRRTSNKTRRSTSVEDRESSTDQDAGEHPDDIEVLEESDGKLVDDVIDDQDELVEASPENEAAEEDEEAEEEDEEEQD